MSLATSHDLFPGLTATQRVTVLRRILGDESIPEVVIDFLSTLDGSEPLPVIRPNLAETSDSILGATVAMRSAADGGPAADGFALTQGPPWAAWLPTKPDHVVSVDDDGVVADLEEIHAVAGLRAALLAVTTDEHSRPLWQLQDSYAIEGPVPTSIHEKLHRQLNRRWSKLVQAVLIDEATARDLLLDPSGALYPIAVVDERSVAAVVCEASPATAAPVGSVVRWFLTEVDPAYQGALLDTDTQKYLESLQNELKARTAGLDRILDEIGPSYQEAYLAHEKRPRDFVVRPVRIACQNVIVGLAAIAQESSFDGLSVVAWQTCEVPHVATHEGNRALAALTLCDAFQNGGTMEIRFDRSARINLGGEQKTYRGHPEGRVPASLRRFGRTVGVELGADDAGAITPREARDLFLAVTPMPPGLRDRVERAVSTEGTLPERLCFTLLSQVWREIELDYILATSRRAPSILAGGADWRRRGERQAEAEVCRAALMLGMLFRRLNTQDSAGAGGSKGDVRVIEDRARGVEWQVDDESPVVTLSRLAEGEPLPWLHGHQTEGTLRVVPCSMITDGILQSLTAAEQRVALLVPKDAHLASLPDDALVLRCPDRLADLDKTVEGKLLTSRISRG